MYKAVILAAAFSSALALGGCGATPEQRTVNGALLGAAGGALIGGAATGRAGGAVVGGLAGAAVGGVIGANSAPPTRCVRIRYDEYGNQYCARYARVGY